MWFRAAMIEDNHMNRMAECYRYSCHSYIDLVYVCKVGKVGNYREGRRAGMRSGMKKTGRETECERRVARIEQRERRVLAVAREPQVLTS